ncbi:pyridine nucleotide-disulfide oxidoreductase [Oleomonas cavernae]|uniref:Pyridine nucleotide-disulfide oxidoreductase n=1 Tax=Oleomonas cavernae TaxID=2320859 RepID=A0A418WH65_9PROT|nr:FAD-dependent oxidoreductase [Oleomonas cavernae]RJF89384.1 pyridine nucleotide-disulfide oxidoreductase [Oleomonas cavernae]
MTRAGPSIVIIGAGQAGARAAEALRAAGHAGAVTLIGAEAHPPYERPQLSKEMLLKTDAVPAFVRSAPDWATLGVDLVTGAEIADGDIERGHVAAKDGRVFGFDKLMFATGTVPRRLPALEAGPIPVHYLRTIDDACALRRGFVPGARIVAVGGGVIGLEAAAAAVAQGARATVIEAAPRLLARALPEVVAGFLRRRHEQAGVEFHFGQVPVGANAQGVVLADGRVVPADLIVVGVGVDPVVGLAERLGLAGGQGIKVDAHGRTELPHIFAAGDVALQWSRCHDRWTRIETWANAQNQAIAAARTMAGQDSPYGDPPWFWSDQYDVNLQVLGDAVADDLVLRGDVEAGRFTLIALRAGEVVGAVTVNAARDMAALRRIVAGRQRPARADLENPAFDLRRAAAPK